MGLYHESDEIYSAGVATCEYLNTYYKGKSVHALATESYKKELIKYGINLTEDVHCDVALISYDTELTYDKLCKFVKTLENGAVYIATHPDHRCNTIDGFVPDVGAFIKMIEESNAFTPSVIIGKPMKTMGDTLKNRYEKNAKKFMMVGDRLDTDLMFGLNNDFYFTLVLTGETSAEEAEVSSDKPHFILETLNDIVKYF